MSWASAMTQLKANLVTAGTDVTPNITNVREGEPDSLTQDTIAFWASGFRESETGGYTAGGKLNIERGVEVNWYLRGAVRSGQIDIDAERRLVAVEEAILTRLYADVDLNGNAIGIAVRSSDYGWTEIAQQLARTGKLTVWIDLAEVASISQ